MGWRSHDWRLRWEERAARHSGSYHDFRMADETWPQVMPMSSTEPQICTFVA